METLANIQKEMVARCNLAGKPVVVATQMLESMQKNPRPTRAECTDVANAVFDGADCVMLSGESAKGRFPVKSVETMRRIVIQAERFISGHDSTASSRQLLGGIPYNGVEPGIGSAIAEASRGVKARCVVVIGENHELSANISRFRPDIPIIAVLPSSAIGIKAAKLLQLHRAVYPLLEDARDKSILIGKLLANGLATKGDRLVMVQAETRGANRDYSNCITTSTLTVE
jgi:pyruvate kinase